MRKLLPSGLEVLAVYTPGCLQTKREVSISIVIPISVGAHRESDENVLGRVLREAKHGRQRE